MDWLKGGDKNMLYFHAKVVHRRVQSKTTGLEDGNGVRHEETKEVQKIVIDYFTNNFQTSNPSGFAEVLHCVPSPITVAMNRDLTKPPSTEEVRAALFQMAPSRAPGLDGFCVGFFQHYWQEMGGDIVAAVRSFMHYVRLLKGINHTFITLAPKTRCPMNMTQLSYF